MNEQYIFIYFVPTCRQLWKSNEKERRKDSQHKLQWRFLVFKFTGMLKWLMINVEIWGVLLFDAFEEVSNELVEVFLFSTVALLNMMDLSDGTISWSF